MGGSVSCCRDGSFVVEGQLGEEENPEEAPQAGNGLVQEDVFGEDFGQANVGDAGGRGLSLIASPAELSSLEDLAILPNQVPPGDSSDHNQRLRRPSMPPTEPGAELSRSMISSGSVISADTLGVESPNSGLRSPRRSRSVRYVNDDQLYLSEIERFTSAIQATEAIESRAPPRLEFLDIKPWWNFGDAIVLSDISLSNKENMVERLIRDLKQSNQLCRVKILKLANCHLGSIPDLHEMTSLEGLDISGNDLVRLPALPPSLKILMTHENLLKEYFESSEWQTRIRDEFKGLGYMDVSSNSLGSLPPVPDSIVVLKANKNDLGDYVQCGDFENWLRLSPKMELIELRNCEISCIPDTLPLGIRSGRDGLSEVFDENGLPDIDSILKSTTQEGLLKLDLRSNRELRSVPESLAKVLRLDPAVPVVGGGLKEP